MSQYQLKLTVSVTGGSNSLPNQDLISSHSSSPRPVIKYRNWQKVFLCIVLEYYSQLSQATSGNSSQRSVSLTDGTLLWLHSTTAIGRPAEIGSSRGVTEISVPVWTIGLDSKLWGDPENFWPERWLEGKEIRQYVLTFGSSTNLSIEP
ncbi:hypothetical protein B0H13DRAFT_1851187 [Mycena leptocephala]|nr:hypothetical protein B0H13DRAFT_1851187 [Mycena leptocephala]